MAGGERSAVRLEVPAEVGYIPIVTGLVENAAAVFGLGKAEGLELVLAVEEVFAYVATSLCHGAPITVEAASGIYYVRVTLRFPVSELNLRGLNVTSSVSLEGKEGLEEMGLIIATRFVDRLNVSRVHHREVSLDLIKEKRYEPLGEGREAARMPSGPVVRVVEPATEAITDFAAAVCRAYGEPLRPSFFRYPGKVADMAASGEYRVLMAVDERGHPAGGLMFFHRTERLVQFYGPYVARGADMGATAAVLTEALMGRIARTKTIGVVAFNVPEAGLLNGFEELGVLSFERPGALPLDMPVYYRLLHEDPGGVVWTRQALLPFLEEQYERLVLAREITIVRDHGESSGDRSIFSADIEAGESRAMLRPLWPGSDFEENLGKHVATFVARGIANILCELDLGVAWQSRAIEPLLRQHFVPRLVVPFAGKSDLVIFRYHAPTP